MILLVDSTSMDVAMGWQCFGAFGTRLCEAVILLFRHSSSYPTAKEKNRPSIYRESWSFADHVYGDQPERMSRTYAQTDNCDDAAPARQNHDLTISLLHWLDGYRMRFCLNTSKQQSFHFATTRQRQTGTNGEEKLGPKVFSLAAS